MPFALVRARRSTSPDSWSEDDLISLAHDLPTIVAQALSCSDPGGSLTPADIEVSIQYKDPRLDIGGESHHFEITIFANDFPSRRANIQERTQQIVEAIKDLCDQPQDNHGFVWIRLAPAGFAEF